MEYLNDTVWYLQDEDFDSNGKLINKNIPKDKLVLIMIQAKYCGHCKNAKPAFQEFANKNKNKVFSATIQADGLEKGETDLGKRLSLIKPEFRGYPDYVVYYNGNRVERDDIKGRDVSSLEEFVFRP